MNMAANPYRAGAGHSPPHLAGRINEIAEFSDFLEQDTVARNLILTGLRGVGKTVLMDDKYRPLAIQKGWAWVGSDFSESAFLTEINLCTRLLTDLSVFSSSLTVSQKTDGFGFSTGQAITERTLDFDFLLTLFQATPGLSSDRLKAVLELVWKAAEHRGVRGIVFAYDESQVVSDNAEKDQYPLAVLLETFQSLQRKGCRYLLLLTGLPTLFPRLVESRTYAERMFAVQEIDRLDPDASREAIEVPLASTSWSFSDESVATVINTAQGYPYFIQFICRQAFDYMLANSGRPIPIEPIVRQLDSNFFSGRWETLTDRQRELLYVIAHLENADNEFMIADITSQSKQMDAVKKFSAGDVSQMLPRLIDKGLIFKNRHGKYSFAVPLFSGFIRRYVERQTYAQMYQKTLLDK